MATLHTEKPGRQNHLHTFQQKKGGNPENTLLNFLS
jgi:hypothetical protein